ncbi:MAG: response regulator [Deltaproteobacteria bacterium]|nr:response regulator [Deltaproteobacteria bacterium]
MLQEQETDRNRTLRENALERQTIAEILRLAKERQRTEASQKVLLVDDVRVVREVLRKSLEALGYDVVGASGGREAVSLFLKQGREFAGVVLDMSMPDLDGMSTLRALKAIDPSVVVVMSSGSFTEYSSPPTGAAACIQKPCSLERLRTCMAMTL